MTLSGEQLNSVIFGAADKNEAGHGTHFLKCLQEERADWYAAKETLGQRAGATTGIMADFHTNSKTVTFVVWEIKFEVMVNGLTVYQLLSPTEKAFHTFSVQLDGKDNRVTLVFPSHRVGYLREIRLDDGAYVKPHHYDYRFLFNGDSITQGWNAELDSLSYAHRISEMYNAERVINGTGGAFFRASAFRKIKFDPDVVFIAYGTNDFKHYTEKAEFEANVTGYLNQIQKAYPKALIVDILPIWRADYGIELPLGTLDYVRDFIKKACDERNIPTVDGFELVPHMPAFYFDHVHPNDLGFQLYAENLKKELDKLLKAGA